MSFTRARATKRARDASPGPHHPDKLFLHEIGIDDTSVGLDPALLSVNSNCPPLLTTARLKFVAAPSLAVIVLVPVQFVLTEYVPVSQLPHAQRKTASQ